ncbi:MAG: hypothetical protein AAF798_10035, partial [Bacteroidota bacterium]
KFLAGEISYPTFLEYQFKRLFSSYALAFNKQEHRTGSLFQKRFKRIFIRTEFRLWYLLAYIHHNPIHHFYTAGYGQWPFCSYQAILSHQPTLVARNKVLEWLDTDGEKARAIFIQLHEDFRRTYAAEGDADADAG